MVQVEIRATGQSEPLAVVYADDQDGARVEGPWREHISLEDTQLGLPVHRLVTADEHPEDWARGLTVAFRSPDLWASIVHDDNPLDAGEPVEVRRAVAH